MDALASKILPGDIKITLQNLRKLPHGGEALTTLYEQAMRRINDQEENCRLLAHKTLSWITLAKRPLATLELQHALAVRSYSVDFDEAFVPEIEDIVSVCAGLITTDEGSGMVRWIHYTTQEYFEKSWRKWLPSAQVDVARTCVFYLSLSVFGNDRTEDEEPPAHGYCLYDYAAKHWGMHVKSSRDNRYVNFLNHAIT